MAEDNEPRWMHNFDIQGAEWLAVATEPVLPCCVPEELQLQQQTMVLQVNELQNLIYAAVHHGTFFKVEELKLFLRTLKAPFPRKKPGQKGGVKKQEYATALVKCLQPAADEGEVARMVAGILGKKGPVCGMAARNKKKRQRGTPTRTRAMAGGRGEFRLGRCLGGVACVNEQMQQCPGPSWRETSWRGPSWRGPSWRGRGRCWAGCLTGMPESSSCLWLRSSGLVFF